MSRKQLLTLAARADDERAYATTGNQVDATKRQCVEDPEPLRLAESFIERHYTFKSDELPMLRLRLRHYRGDWYAFNGCGYQELEPEDLRAQLYPFLDQIETPRRDREGRRLGTCVKLVARSTLVREVEQALLGCGTRVAGAMPQWLDGRNSPSPADVVTFKNCLLDAQAFCERRQAELSPTPAWFGVAGCPYDYKPGVDCPLWKSLLADWFEKDEKSIALLQEWFGYSLVSDNRYEKIMMFVGPPRSGKGTTISALTAMLGGEQVAMTSFFKLASRFGLNPLLGKLAAILPDAHISRSTDAKAALEVIKSISGNDDQAVDRKGVKELPRVRLPVRFTIAVNELPELPDDAGAIKPRLLLLYFPKSYAGKEDPTLKAKVAAEASGIANWALDGLRRLRATGTFTIPDKSSRIVAEFERTVSPVLAFLHERCEEVADHWVPKDELYRAWCDWCGGRGSQPGTLSKFGQQLINAAPAIRSRRRGPRGQQFTTYEGVRLCN